MVKYLVIPLDIIKKCVLLQKYSPRLKKEPTILESSNVYILSNLIRNRKDFNV